MKNYKVHLINDKKLNKYIQMFPNVLKQAASRRKFVICDYDGIFNEF